VAYLLKGKKRDKVEAHVSYATAASINRNHLDIGPKPISQTQLGTTWYPRALSPQPISI
jgi:hypothetical protein